MVVTLIAQIHSIYKTTYNKSYISTFSYLCLAEMKTLDDMKEMFDGDVEKAEHLYAHYTGDQKQLYSYCKEIALAQPILDQLELTGFVDLWEVIIRRN